MPPRTPAPSQPPATLLVVDDEPSIRAFLALLLSAEGFHVVTAEDGLEALQAAAEEPPDVVLTDVVMPRLDGPGLIARLRAAELPLAGVIAMSSATDAGRVPEADRFLTKPFDIDAVLTSVTELLAASPAAPSP